MQTVSIRSVCVNRAWAVPGDAKLLVRGALLGARQDASILVTDFPMAMLQPVFCNMPTLQHATPAALARGTPRARSRATRPLLAATRASSFGSHCPFWECPPATAGVRYAPADAEGTRKLGGLSPLNLRIWRGLGIGVDRVHSTSGTGFANSPIHGLLFLRGSIGGSVAAPEVGRTLLARLLWLVGTGCTVELGLTSAYLALF